MEIMCYKLSIGYDPNVEKTSMFVNVSKTYSVMKKNICFSIICMESTYCTSSARVGLSR